MKRNPATTPAATPAPEAAPVLEPCERLHAELLALLLRTPSTDADRAARLGYLAAMASELRLRVEREVGRLITRRPDPGGRPRACEQSTPRAIRLALGLDRSTAARLRALAALDVGTFERVIDGLWSPGCWPVPRAASGVVRATLPLRAGADEATSALGGSPEISQVGAQIETETP